MLNFSCTQTLQRLELEVCGLWTQAQDLWSVDSDTMDSGSDLVDSTTSMQKLFQISCFKIRTAYSIL